MAQAKKQDIVNIHLDYQEIGGLYVFVITLGLHKIQYVRRQDMLEHVRGVFLNHSNDEVNLYVTRACSLTPEELNYVSGGRINAYEELERAGDMENIREGGRGNSRHPPENIVPFDATKLEFSTESYDFYYHKKSGDVTLYVVVTNYHPGMLAVPVKKLKEVIKYLADE
ncbi:MAG: hypothetical protein JSW02_04435 [candidate division WOR-3 bacterium]|nr:MAG: hypothetical protein JSW02_04435 [candidate division WOR-3 bacterium]